jgi:hypothetical protein
MFSNEKNAAFLTIPSQMHQDLFASIVHRKARLITGTSFPFNGIACSIAGIKRAFLV